MSRTYTKWSNNFRRLTAQEGCRKVMMRQTMSATYVNQRRQSQKATRDASGSGVYFLSPVKQTTTDNNRLTLRPFNQDNPGKWHHNNQLFWIFTWPSWGTGYCYPPIPNSGRGLPHYLTILQQQHTESEQINSDSPQFCTWHTSSKLTEVWDRHQTIPGTGFIPR